MSNPTCRACKGETVKSMANWKEFYYCRTCKVEVDDQELPEFTKFGLDSFNLMSFDGTSYGQGFYVDPNDGWDEDGGK